MEVEKLTTRYDAHEDRLCIDGQGAAGEVLSLWLTCRLMRRIVPVLVRLITPAAEAEDKAASLAEWALSRARAEQMPASAVTRPALSRSPDAHAPRFASCLVSSIELQGSPKEAVLMFRIAANEVVATIALRPEHLRQWLSIVYRLWRGAGWPTNEWPAWMSDTSAAPEGAVLH